MATEDNVVHFDGRTTSGDTRAAKRGVGAMEQASDSDGDIPSKLAGMFAAQNVANAATAAKLQQDVLAGVQELVDKKIEKVQKQQNQLAEKVDGLEQDHLGLAAQVGELQAIQTKMADEFRLARRESIEREEVASDRFDRPASQEFIRISSRKVVSVEAVSGALAPWLADTCHFRGDEWKLIVGQVPGKQFVLKFLQVPLSNARMVSTAMSSLKDEEGVYRIFEATAADGSKNQLRIDRDENERSRTQRRMGAVLLKAIEKVGPKPVDLRIRRDHRKGMLSIFGGGDGICTMVPTSTQVTRDYFKWNNPALMELGLDKSALLDEALALLERPEDNIQWCL